MSELIPRSPMSRLSKTSTLADLAAHIAGDPALEGRKAKDVAWALRTVARACGTACEETRIDPRSLNEKLEAFAPATIGVGAATWSNAMNLTRFALRHVGLIKEPPKRTVPLAPAWTAVMRELTDQGHLIGICRLARFCTEQGIDPEQVDDGVFDALLTELESGQIKSGGRKVHRRTAQIWNQLANTIRDWPSQVVKVPNYSKRYALDWADLPASLKQDVDRHIAELDGSDKRTLARTKKLKPSSIKTRRHQLHILISGMVLGGVDRASLQTLTDVVKPDSVEVGLQFLIARVGEDRLAQAHDVLRTVVSVARHYVKAPESEVKSLADLCRRWDKDQTKGMSDKNRELLRQFDEEANVLAFLNLPDSLVEKAKLREGRATAADALVVQTALVIALLQMIPIRRHNVACLRISKHFERKRDGSVYLFISGKEVKNGVDVDARLVPEVVRLLDLYLKTYRPLLAEASSDWLIPGVQDRPKSRERLAHQISYTIKHEIGLTVHMHLFRHIAAKLYLDANPGGYGVVQRLQGHKSIQTTIGTYCGAETRSAVAHYDRSVLARKAGRLEAR